MKKIAAFFTALIVFLIGINVFHYNISGDLRTNNRAFGTWYNAYKDLSYNALSQNMHYDTMPVFGSSEFRHGRGSIYHPKQVFAKSDASIMTIGGPYNMCLNHAITLGALSDKIKNKKAVLLVSPTWFYKHGVIPIRYSLRFSESNYMAFMENPHVSKSVKKYVAKRTENLLRVDLDKYRLAKRTDDIYVRNSKSKLKKKIYNIHKAYVHDKEILGMTSIMKKSNIKRYPKYMPLPKSAREPDWTDLILKAQKSSGKISNNPYNIDEKSWKRDIRAVYSKQKNRLKDETLSDSPEFDDLETFLTICKEQKIRPMLVVLPVNGKWYDYVGLTKEKRHRFIKRMHKIGKKYNAKVVDFAQYEYAPNILKDTVHPKKEGWVRINEEIYKFYKEM